VQREPTKALHISWRSTCNVWESLQVEEVEYELGQGYQLLEGQVLLTHSRQSTNDVPGAPIGEATSTAQTGARHLATM
jgi:hypothetical protein